MWLGAHIGIGDGLAEAPYIGRRIGCEAIQIFSKSPYLWKGPAISDESAGAFGQAVKGAGLKATTIHHCYLVNLASPKPSTLTLSRRTFVDELERAEKLGVDSLIFHPGAHLGGGADAGHRLIAESLNWAFAQTPGFRVRALLENCAGQGTALCARFEDLASVLAKVEDRGRVGVAIDTCHLFASGVDFRTEEGYGAMVDSLEATLGAREVRAFHLNDTKGGLGSHLDRHENIGKGILGLEGFRRLVNDGRWKQVPGYLETPFGDDYSAYEKDLRTLRGLLVAGRPVPKGTRAERPPSRRSTGARRARAAASRA